MNTLPILVKLPFLLLLYMVLASLLSAQAIQQQSAVRVTGEPVITREAILPVPRFEVPAPGEVSLRSGLFRERRELTKAYVLRLKTDDLLQNHLLEAGVRIDRPVEQMHQGWEAPHCQLRGHFAGHWLSAAEHFAATDRDPIMAARAAEVVRGLRHCQELNGGEWLGSIPEKFFGILSDKSRWVWSPQYTLHKTMMGLFDAYRYAGDREVLAMLSRSADWYLKWTEGVARAGQPEAVYGGECAGMLELWADLYGATKDEKYLRLAARYGMPDLFGALRENRDTLTNDHANASIPWIQGAARLYEVTGDVRYRGIVESFWRQAVENRGMFATTGANAGEFWIPPYQFGRFLSSRTQEHCTAYNMIRVAQYLFRWTGEARYAAYIERALYNAILAQQNPHTGLVSYFLPLNPGAKKVWGTETRDFWCCHGTLVQAQASFEDLIYYRADDGVTVSQYISSAAVLDGAGRSVRITQQADLAGGAPGVVGVGDMSHVAVNLTIASEAPVPWTLRLRQPDWAVAVPAVTVDDQPVAVTVSKDGFIELTRVWKSARVRVMFPKRVQLEPLPGDPRRVALVDGPVVLGALTAEEPTLATPESIVVQHEHQYVDGRDWQFGHYLVATRRGSVKVKPLYEIADEVYTVYFLTAP